MRKERDELKEAVRSFEAELTQIQLDTKMLAEDRDNFKLLYEQVEIIFLIFDTIFEVPLLFRSVMRLVDFALSRVVLQAAVDRLCSSEG